MCQLFIKADPGLWRSKLRSVRLHGYSTSVRLENVYWRLLEEISARDGLSVNEILARLYEELLETQGEVENFASFLRVCCTRYLMLQMAGDIPADLNRSIAGLDSGKILAREKARLDVGSRRAGWTPDYVAPMQAPPAYFAAPAPRPRARAGYESAPESRPSVRPA